MSEGPQRRIVMRAKIEADSWEDLYGHLHSLTTEMACNGKRLSKRSVSGGFSSGHIIVIEESEDMTHDKWAADLDAHLEAMSDADTAQPPSGDEA